jgi:hypothetical protein
MPRSRLIAPLPAVPPTPHELVVVPELTLLAALNHLLELATLTVVAIHPELASDQSPRRPLDPQAVLADRIIQLASRLTETLTRYRAAALASLQRPDTDDDPF